MGERKWTAEQLSAINTRDKTLLVCAAAGSGKTATLTERIIRSILDEKNPSDISKMLIVTFTNAAVGELRERVSDAIRRAAKENPGNVRLEEQLLKVKDASIVTIDAFCNSILKSSAEYAGLSPNYRIAETAEAALLGNSIMNALIGAAYAGELSDTVSAEDFFDLADCLTGIRDENSLSEVLQYVYDKTTGSVSGIDVLSHLREEYNPENYTAPENTGIGKYIIKKTKEAFSAFLSSYEQAISSIRQTAAAETKFPATLESDTEIIRSVLSCDAYGDMQKAFSEAEFEKAPSLRAEAAGAAAMAKELRALFKDCFNEYKKDFFTYSVAEWEELYTFLYKSTGIIYSFLKKYDELFMEEKRRRGICEYNDITRYTYRMLYDENGNVTDLSKEIAQRYDAIYIDEYQDVNELQGRIFDAISKPTNRFMVGDIKQSIYGFRAACPDIFAEMKNTYPKLDVSGDSPMASVFMSANFRCDEPIIAFTNAIFDKMFGYLGKNIGYMPEDNLVFSKIYAEGESPSGDAPEIHIVESPKSKSAKIAEDMIESEEDAVRLCAKTVAKKVKELILFGKKADGTPIAPDDVAIILRKVRRIDSIYKEALEEVGIPASVAVNSDFFLNEEVLLTLALLNCIDNPKKDVYLAAALLSPVFNFTADDLLIIRKTQSVGTLYDAVVSYTQLHPSFKRGEDFLRRLSSYRRMAEDMGADKLLSLLYRECGLLTLAAGKNNGENLILLRNYAEKFEASTFRGLHSFISYINEVLKNKKEIDELSGGDAEGGAVKIMSAHKSKGLEFPVCIFAEAQSPIHSGSVSSVASRIKFDINFGFAICAKHKSGLALVANPVMSAINHYVKSMDYEESLRVLYVILTRAREKLYIYGSTVYSKTLDDTLTRIRTLKDNMSEFMSSQMKSMLEIIMSCHMFGKLVTHPIEESVADGESATENITVSEQRADAEREQKSKQECDEALALELAERFLFEYPKKHLLGIPEKLSVSKLTPSVLDTEGESFDLTADEAKSKRGVLPKFVTGHAEDESAKRGIATHMFMQFCDFSRLKELGARAELQRLISEEFLSAEDGKRVRLAEIDGFTKSALFSEMLDAKKLYRELRFNLKLPASSFTEDKERGEALAETKLLAQGVIDCIIEGEDGSLHLVDYKTDRLTREELDSPESAEARLLLAHRRQLKYYEEAVSRMFGRAPSRVGIYSLHLGREISVSDGES